MIPEQHPEVPPRYRFRPRSDRYAPPSFFAPMDGRVVVERCRLEPIETYDPRNEARPFEWDELRDPEVIVGGLAMFVAMCAIVVIVFLSSVA